MTPAVDDALALCLVTDECNRQTTMMEAGHAPARRTHVQFLIHPFARLTQDTTERVSSSPAYMRMFNSDACLATLRAAPQVW